MYNVGDVSEMTGLSIKTLHYYEKLGLLKPKREPRNGYRIYEDHDLLKLQEIMILKKMGFTLTEVKQFYQQQDIDNTENRKEQVWSTAIKRQIDTLSREEERINKLKYLLQSMLYAIEATGEVNHDHFETFIKELTRVNKDDKYHYRSKTFTDKEISQLPSGDPNDPSIMEWATLLREIRQNIGEHPNSSKSQKLAKRIIDYANKMFHGDEQLADKYWDSIRPTTDGKENLYGLDVKVMEYIDKIVTRYLQEKEESSYD